MTWHHAFFVVLWIISFVAMFVEQCRDESKSSSTVTLNMMCYVGVVALQAWVLHEGGFW